MTSLTILKVRAKKAVDQVAGAARQDILTDIPLQSHIYAIKLAQATAYTAAYQTDPMANVPGYVVAESQARECSAIEAAAAIITAASAFDDARGPAIERARIAGKRAIDACGNAEAVESARIAATAAIISI